MDQHLQDLLGQMTLEEKIGQLLQLAGHFYEGAGGDGQITGPMAALGIGEDHVRNSGSVLGLSGAETVAAVQEAHLKNNRLRIPLLVMADIVHGYRTIFPIPLAIGCSWDLELAERSAEAAAREAAVSGIHVTFAPMVDLVRDPRWGRVMESTGEDPYLNSLFAAAFVRGFQGGDLAGEPERVAACVKHFAAYGAAEAGRDYNTVDLSERQLREYYLPAYKAALDQGAEMVMTSFNTVDGIPASGNRKLMRDLLRGEWGFDGVLISDWGAVKEMIPHGVAADEAEAARKAIQAGVDIEMMTACYVRHLPALVESGAVDESLIDEAVLRILALKKKLGLFERPLRGADPAREREVLLCAEHRAIARELAAKACVLLKNEGGVLPLKREQRVALVGPFAKSGDLLGAWSWLGKQEETVRLYDGMTAIAGPSRIAAAEGCGIEAPATDLQWAEVLTAADGADVIVAALGEHSGMSGEACSRADIRLPQAQLDLLARLRGLGKPVVLVLFNGRPLDLHGAADAADAVLEAWYPGTEGGAAVAELLYGVRMPSGRLTMSFPHAVGQVPVYYNAYNTGRPKDAPNADAYVSKYLDIPNEPLFPFGFGLGYTSFAYEDARLSGRILTAEEPITLTVKVTNTGGLPGEETVQLYVRDLAGDVVRPLKELKDYRKVNLQPGESAEVSFAIAEPQLRYYHADLSYASDPGEFIAYVGGNSRDTAALPFRLEKTNTK